MSPRDDFPNVIFIVFDTARADAFSPYGAAGDPTPVARQLASRGSAHPKAIAACNWTMPSHAAMLTGLLPRTAGLSLLPEGQQKNCRYVLEHHRHRYLPEILRRAGYRTVGASTNLWVSPRLGFATGFDEFHNLVGRRVRRMHGSSLRVKIGWYVQALLARADDGLQAAEELLARLISQQPSEQPFFWFVNLIECHSPYLPPAPFNDFGPINRVRAAHDARMYQTLPGVWRCCSTSVPPPEPALERMRHMYAQAVRMMDAWLGRIVERLDDKGLLDETLVVLTSDHGENFGEGGLIGHAVSLDDRLLHVPLIFAGPTVPRNGRVTSLASLPRLIAESIGLKDHPWPEEELPRDAAVAQYDTGVQPTPSGTLMFKEWGATEEGLRRFTEAATCATDGRYKVVVQGEKENLYDLASDPLEERPLPLSGPAAPRIDHLHEALRAAKRSEWTPNITALKNGQADLTSDRELRELEDRMRLLGYM